jgi:hypothetical protein
MTSMDARPPETAAPQRDVVFPFDLLRFRDFPGDVGTLIRELEFYSLQPPYPWGQWLYADLITTHLADVPGDFAELGVGRGGMSLFLGHFAKQQGRTVYSLDSFEGLPDPDPARDNLYFKRGFYLGNQRFGQLHDRFVQAIGKYGLNETIKPVKGFFADTVPELPAGELSFLHIDADLYESVKTALVNLYDRVVPGGVIVIDDFFHPAQGPARALSDFFNARELQPLLHVSFPYTIFLIKGEEAGTRRHRAIDGNIYSVDWLARDDFLRSTVDQAVADAEARAATENRRRFRDLLAAPAGDGSEIYEYWRTLSEFWQCMDYRPTDNDTWTI